MAEPLIPPVRAGIVRRAAGFVVDSAVLGAVGIVLGSLGFAYFSAMGVWARLVGIGISTAYFTTTLGPRFGGQTLGHRLLKIRVVARDGKPMTVSSRLVRALVITIPFILNGVSLGARSTDGPIWEWVMCSATQLLLGMGAANIYLLLFNRRSGRGLHDLLAGTDVVLANEAGWTNPAPIWRWHWVVLGVGAISLVAIAGVFELLAQTSFFAELLKTRRAVESLPGVQSADVSISKTWSDGGRTESKFSVTVRVGVKPDSFEMVADSVAQTVIKLSPGAQKSEAVNIAVVYGYDIGIATASVKQIFSHPPGEWPTVARGA